MFVIYYVLWVICLLLLLSSIFYALRKRRYRKNAAIAPNQSSNYVVVDMCGRPQQMQPQHPPSCVFPPSQTNINNTPPYSSNINPPPPSYQDYSKDYRVNYVS